MNSGVMVMRNNKWMRKLMDEIGKYGEYPVDWSIEQVASPHYSPPLPVPHPRFLSDFAFRYRTDLNLRTSRSPISEQLCRRHVSTQGVGHSLRATILSCG